MMAIFVVAHFQGHMNLLTQVLKFNIFFCWNFIKKKQKTTVLEPFNKGKVSDVKCEYEFRSSNEKFGYFMSPTYPGTYPNAIDCNYKFIGDANERVSIHFDEIAMHYGAEQYESLFI